ncbi:MAG: hypothetical protein KF727_14495 [Microbacteriaceae bacterium]|nr:hypothetical protein [Microbacteriaceae bacterium]
MNILPAATLATTDQEPPQPSAVPVSTVRTSRAAARALRRRVAASWGELAPRLRALAAKLDRESTKIAAVVVVGVAGTLNGLWSAATLSAFRRTGWMGRVVAGALVMAATAGAAVGAVQVAQSTIHHNAYAQAVAADAGLRAEAGEYATAVTSRATLLASAATFLAETHDLAAQLPELVGDDELDELLIAADRLEPAGAMLADVDVASPDPVPAGPSLTWADDRLAEAVAALPRLAAHYAAATAEVAPALDAYQQATDRVNLALLAAAVSAPRMVDALLEQYETDDESLDSGPADEVRAAAVACADASEENVAVLLAEYVDAATALRTGDVGDIGASATSEERPTTSGPDAASGRAHAADRGGGRTERADNYLVVPAMVVTFVGALVLLGFIALYVVTYVWYRQRQWAYVHRRETGNLLVAWPAPWAPVFFPAFVATSVLTVVAVCVATSAA